MSSKIRNILILSTILGCGMILRLQGLFHTLEYDEIWTLQTFLNQSLRRIFSDFALPNNHPLNTVAVCLAYFGKECAWTIRLGAFSASLGTIFAGYFLARRLSGKQAGFFTALALAVLPPFVAAGCSARTTAVSDFNCTVFAEEQKILSLVAACPAFRNTGDDFAADFNTVVLSVGITHPPPVGKKEKLP